MRIPRPKNVTCITTAVLSDLHVPYHDEVALGCALAFLKEHPPDRFILNGDICDFYQISKFSKDPSRKDKLQEDLDTTNGILDLIDRTMPDARKDFIFGNHEARLLRWCWDNEGVGSLRDMTLDRQLKLSERGYKLHHPKGKSASMKIGVVEVGHFNRCNKHSAYTAKNLVEDRGCSVVQGHTHRMGVHYKTKGGIGQMLVGVEGGCLCDLNPEYVNAPDWQHGFVLLQKQKGSSRFHIQQFAITGGELLVGSRRY